MARGARSVAALVFPAYLNYSFPDTAATDGGIAFGTLASGMNAQERMRISSLGNVGIGTTSPSATLHVSSGAGISPTTQNGPDQGAVLCFKESTIWSRGSASKGNRTSATNTSHKNIILTMAIPLRERMLQGK